MTRRIALHVVLAISWLAGAVAYSPAEEGVSATRKFLSTPQTHGISLEDARALGTSAFPELAAALRDDSAKLQWATAAVIMAMIEHPNALDTLNSFMWHRFKGPVDDVTFNSMGCWFRALAVGSKPGDQRVLAFLARGTNPAFWDSLPWSYPALGRVRRNENLSWRATYALGHLPGNDARAVLQRLEARPYFPDQSRAVRYALASNEEITRLGVEEYLRREAQRHGGGGSGGR